MTSKKSCNNCCLIEICKIRELFDDAFAKAANSGSIASTPEEYEEKLYQLIGEYCKYQDPCPNQ